ncbi:MAG: ComEC/Rec2 family competence protein [Oscillospiraceae bacterium]
MARQGSTGKKYKTKEQKWGAMLSALVLALVLGVLMLTVPGFSDEVFEIFGIRRSEAAVAAQVDSATKVHIIDVLQGDAALLEQNGEFALIDAGPPEGQDNLLAYLNGLGITRLKYVILTHPHADHYGGMQAVVENFTVEQMILPDLSKAPTPTASTFQRLLEALANKKVKTKTAKEGDSYPLGTGSIRVLQAGLETKDNYNLLSLALLFEADGFRFLDTGDAEKQNEQALLQSGADLRADVFMAGHHGSSTSNSKSFLQAVRPEVVAISLGAGNSYGHPHREAMAAFEEQNATILRTDQNGTIVLGPGENGGVVYAVAKQPAGSAA